MSFATARPAVYLSVGLIVAISVFLLTWLTLWVTIVTQSSEKERNMIQIKNWLTGALIFEADVDTVKLCLELGVSKGVDFSYAKLNYAKLNYADLNHAKLNYAKLNHAELNYAELFRIDGFKFCIILTKTHVHIGCRRFTKEQFKNIDILDGEDDGNCFDQYETVLKIIESIEKYQGES